MTAAGSEQVTPPPVLWVRLDAAVSRLRWRSHRLQNRGLRRHRYVRVGARGHWLAASPTSLSIGPHASIGSDHTVIVDGALSIGANFFANRGLHLCCQERITIGDDVLLGERVSFHDENHVFEPIGATRSAYTTDPIHVGDRVWIGANVVVAGGASIGADSVIGANSVVTGEIPPGVLAAGTPARVLRPLTTADRDGE